MLCSLHGRWALFGELMDNVLPSQDIFKHCTDDGITSVTEIPSNTKHWCALYTLYEIVVFGSADNCKRSLIVVGYCVILGYFLF